MINIAGIEPNWWTIPVGIVLGLFMAYKRYGKNEN